MPEMLTKLFSTPLEIKADGEGAVQAVVSTFHITDKDGDVVLPSAFTAGQQVPMVWSHQWDSPVGRGTISVEADRAVFSGRFFTETEKGREAWLTAKAMQELQEWSYGFAPTAVDYETRDGTPVRVIRQAKIYEVSPVLVGAGENTRTLAIKAAAAESKAATFAIPVELVDRIKRMDSTAFGDLVQWFLDHPTADSKAAIPFKATAKAPDDEAWSAPALKDFTDKAWGDLSDAEKNAIAAHFAWSASMPPATFGDLKLPHHNPAGQVVFAGIVACAGRMNQAQIPDGDMAAVKSHIRQHYAQFDKEPPDVLKEVGSDSSESKGLPYAEHIEAVLAAAKDVSGRSKALAALRSKEGRTLSTANREKLAGLLDALQSVGKEIEDLLAVTEKPPPEKAINAAYLERRLRVAGGLLAIHTN